MLHIWHQLNPGHSKVHPTTENHMHFNWITPAISLRLRAAAEPGTRVRRGSMSVAAPSQPQQNSARKWKTNDWSRESRRSNTAAASQLGQTPGGSVFLRKRRQTAQIFWFRDHNTAKAKGRNQRSPWAGQRSLGTTFPLHSALPHGNQPRSSKSAGW